MIGYRVMRYARCCCCWVRQCVTWTKVHERTLGPSWGHPYNIHQDGQRRGRTPKTAYTFSGRRRALSQSMFERLEFVLAVWAVRGRVLVDNIPVCCKLMTVSTPEFSFRYARTAVCLYRTWYTILTRKPYHIACTI